MGKFMNIIDGISGFLGPYGSAVGAIVSATYHTITGSKKPSDRIHNEREREEDEEIRGDLLQGEKGEVSKSEDENPPEENEDRKRKTETEEDDEEAESE